MEEKQRLKYSDNFKTVRQTKDKKKGNHTKIETLISTKKIYEFKI